MDITKTTTAAATTIKTPEAENETPTRIQPKPVSFANGVLKRTQPVHHHHHGFNNNHHAVVVVYRECLKNHAASIGGLALDGCGEFMPSPTTNPTDPTSLKCAACGCHRNFHRREPEEPRTLALEYQPHHRHHPPPPSGGHSSPSSPSPPPISSSFYPSAPHMLLALSSAGLSAPASEPISATANAITPASGGTANRSNSKRFRTKFTQDQKEKMREFAEKAGWKIQKCDEELIRELCNEIGVDKPVLKVWMHNNKSTLGKRDRNSNIITSTANINNGNGIGNGTFAFCKAAATTAAHYHHHHHQDDNDNNNGGESSVSAHVVATNGSSSSS